MSLNNENYAMGLKRDLTNLYNRAAKRVAKKVLRSVIVNTRQDSGQAAYNWKWTINGVDMSQPVDWVKGTGTPGVGDRGEHRTASGDTFRAARPRLAEFQAEVDVVKEIKSIFLYNPIPGKYADDDHAKLDMAVLIAQNPGVLDEEIAKEMIAGGF